MPAKTGKKTKPGPESGLATHSYPSIKVFQNLLAIPLTPIVAPNFFVYTSFMEVCKITTEKLGCAYFFMAPALVYGIFTSRLPALEKSIGMTDKGAGTLLLALGVATVIGLALCSLLIDRLGAKRTTGISAIFMMATIILAAAANSLWLMAVLCFATGICVGFCDVAMNAQGIYMETCHKTFCLSFLHGCSSLGGVIGSLTGSLFAALGLSPFLNLLVVLGIYFCFWPIAFANITNFSDKNVGVERKTNWRSVAFAVYLGGLLSLVCHVAEGSTAEWGSLLLYDVKGATQSEAALVFAAYTGAMVVCRFMGDSLRHAIPDIVLLFWGSLLGASGMTLVLLAEWPVLCLAGYAIMGVGLL